MQLKSSITQATLIGTVAVLIWGGSLPVVRILEDQIGVLRTIGLIFLGSGLLGLIRQQLKKDGFPTREIFSNPFLYGRWLFFVLHEVLIISAIFWVQKKNVPFVILINYLWPTSIILWSIVLAGVHVTRWRYFLLGTAIVVGSLTVEMMGPSGFSTHLFENETDCLAYLMAFFGAMSWGLYCAVTRRAGEQSGGSVVISFFQLTLGFALPLSFLPQFQVPWNLSLAGVFVLTAYCVFQFVGYLCWDFGIRKGNVIILSLIADFIPWLSLATASLVLEVSIGLNTVVSAITLVIGAMITRYGTLAK